MLVSYLKYAFILLAALWVVYLLYKSFVYAWIVGIFMMPLSMELEAVKGLGITFPSDFLAIILWLFVLVKFIERYKEYFHLLNDKLALLLVLYLTWMFVASVFSTDILVSVKRSLNISWYMLAFFWFSVLLFRRSQYFMTYWLKISLVPVVFVALWITAQTALAGFEKLGETEYFVPFYKDHTVYGASVGFFFFSYYFMIRHPRNSLLMKWAYALGFIIVFIIVLLSATRGTWLGVLASLVFFTMLFFYKKHKPLFWALLVLGVISSGFIIKTWKESLETREIQTSDNPLIRRIQSMLDLRGDQSNLERFNRWTAGIRMLAERPVTGFGPARYKDEYAPYQLSEFITRISTNQGDVGSAHNEIVLALAETGIPGGFLLFAWFLLSVIKATRGYMNSSDKERKILYAIVLGNLITYYVHGMVNNFIDQDKVSIPLFITLAMLVTLDLSRKKNEKQNDL